MRFLSVALALILSWTGPSRLAAQAPAPKLNLVVVEGEGAINNIRQRTAREPIVQVEDQNHKPVAGAVVAFTLPSQGASGTFAGSAKTLTAVTDSQGRAVGRGLRPNNTAGQLQIHVVASLNGLVADTVITQTNLLVGAAPIAGGSVKLIAILAAAGGAVAAGVVYAVTHNGGGSSNGTAVSATTISAGTGTVGAPK